VVVAVGGAVGGKVSRRKQCSQQVYVKGRGQVAGLFELLKEATYPRCLPGEFWGYYNSPTANQEVG
jgi:hypothetical protein